MIFVEQNVDAPLADRVDRWFDGYGLPGTVYLPLAMTDSGHEVNSGSVDYNEVYSQMVDASLERAPGAQMTATGTRSGDLLELAVQITNMSGATLSATNNATLTALVYRESTDPSSVPVIIRAATAPITTLMDGGTGEYILEVVVAGIDPDLTRWVVIADYRPDPSSSAFDTLQAVMGP